MKKTLILFILSFWGIVSYAQNTVSEIDTKEESSLSNEKLVEMYGLIPKEEKGYIAPRFKLYQTENIHILLKLNTATGAIWMLQYEMNDAKAKLIPISEEAAAWVDEEGRPGRFDLYPTKNIHTFIMLDTEKGTTYQVQWDTNPYNCIRFVLFH